MLHGHQRNRIRRALTAALLLGMAWGARGGTIAVRWDPVSDPALTGYRLYWGTSSGTYSQSQDLGTAVSHTLTALSDCTTYYVALKSLDDQGLESGSFSQEISGFTRPTVTAVTPGLVTPGSVTTVAVDGISFQPGASLAFSRAGLTVQSLTVDNCGRLTAELAADVDMPDGPVDVTVMNPGGVPGTLAGGLTVGVDLAPADVLNLHRTDLAGLP